MVEGPILVRDTLEADAPVQAVLVDEEYREELAWLPTAVGDVPVRTIRRGVLERVLDASTPRPIAAVVERRPAELAALSEGSGSPPLWLLLAGVSDPGNAGTLLRSAEAVGARGVVFGEGSVDAYSPKAVRASAGAIHRVTVVEASIAESAAHLRLSGARLVGADQRAETPLEDLDLSRPIGFVLGNEARGLPPDLVALLDDQVRIPMVGRVESLNVAMAGTILLFEAERRRRADQAGGSDSPGGNDGRSRAAERVPLRSTTHGPSDRVPLR